jgi:putative transposase
MASIGSQGDRYGNALAESFHGLSQAGLICHRGPWRGLDYVDWFSQRRLHGELRMVPPAEFEAIDHDRLASGALAVSQ